MPEDGLIEKSTGTEIFEDMYIEELSKEVANRDEGLGIADMLYKQFKDGYIVVGGKFYEKVIISTLTNL